MFQETLIIAAGFRPAYRGAVSAGAAAELEAEAAPFNPNLEKNFKRFQAAVRSTPGAPPCAVQHDLGPQNDTPLWGVCGY